jgi:hypothetical protein
MSGGPLGLRAALARRDLWPAALAVALLHGWLAVALLPVVVLPSSVGVATFVGPTAITPSGPSPALLGAIASAVLGVAGWLAGAGLVAAVVEAALLRTAAGADGRVVPVATPRRGDPLRILAVRAFLAIPLGVALAWSVPRLVAVAYGELTGPSDPAVALPLRVAAGAADVLLLVGAAWLIASRLGGVAARRVAVDGTGSGSAVAAALAAAIRRPGELVRGGLRDAARTALLVVPSLALARFAWEAAGDALAIGSPAALPLALLFVGAWGGSLALLAVVATSSLLGRAGPDAC